MSKGGGSSGPTESKVVQSNLPEYAEPYYKDLLARVGYESAEPYTRYPGQRLSYFTPAEQEAMSRFTEMGVSGTPPELDVAGNIAGAVGMGSPYAGTMLETTRRAQEMPSMGDASAISRYMNPYQQLVLENQMREARLQSEISGQGLGLQAAGQGSLGGYREAIMQAERQRNLGRQLDDIYGAGMQQAFGQAQQALDRDRAYAEAAARLGQSAYGNLLSGDAQRLAASGMLGDYADQRQRMEIERLRNMQAAGETERRLLQAGMDIGYQDFLRQRAYPQEQLAFYSQMLQGTPISPGQTATTFGMQPSTMQQLLGTGIAAAGLYNAFRGPQG
jgi:hypothetical protein